MMINKINIGFVVLQTKTIHLMNLPAASCVELNPKKRNLKTQERQTVHASTQSLPAHYCPRISQGYHSRDV